MTSSVNRYEHLNVTVPKEFVYHVKLNRPKKWNAIHHPMWLEIRKCFEDLSGNENCRVVVLSGAGKVFTAGIDLMYANELSVQATRDGDVARKGRALKSHLISIQESVTAIELCIKPVLVAVHSACVGGGISLATAADIRYCTKDAWFQVKELEIGKATELGALQRLPKIVGHNGWVREICYTARKVRSDEALAVGLVSKVYENKISLIENVIGIAERIAKKSPVAVQGTKHNIIYSRDHTVRDGLDHSVLWNKLMLQSEDFARALNAAITKNPGVHFSKL